MILLNSVERSFYVDSNDDIETRRAGQSGSDARCFELAAETLPYFREGLNKIPAKKLRRLLSIIQKSVRLA